ncbi:MAG: hypothetical protein JWQ23_4510 [Herminiimonas sp.]|jgi:hypothetical protein|nr:hypothetical protein [Herminiimonas sp.]
MYMVYWTQTAHGVNTPHAREFHSDEMRAAMHFMEKLRVRQRAGEGISFVALSSENPHSVGHAGVAETGAGYAWKKRRP